MRTMTSGMQRLLDARGQRGSWIPSKIFVFLSQNFWRPFYSRSPKFFTFFASVVKFHENSLLGCPPMLHHAPVTTFFLLPFWSFTYIFKENWPLGCPPGWMPGAVAPSAPPLHATDYDHTLWWDYDNTIEFLVYTAPCTLYICRFKYNKSTAI